MHELHRQQARLLELDGADKVFLMTGRSPDLGLIVSQSRRIVIKLGTAVVMHEEGGVALSRFNSFVEAIPHLKREGRELLLVCRAQWGWALSDWA